MLYALTALVFTLLPPTPARPAQAAGAPIAVEFLPHAQLDQRLRDLAAAHPGRARYESIGRSRADRDIGCLRLSEGEPRPGQPAIWLVANIEGPQVYSSAAALYAVESLLARADSDAPDSDAKVREFLSTTTLYVIPRAHPDAAEARFGSPLMEVRATGHGIDNDRDGRLGEDGPSDIDGDGIVAWMRVPDVEGGLMEDPRDARALVEAKPAQGESARFALVRESLDSDGDERTMEDPRFDAELNRNFPHSWREHEAAYGLFPTDEPEARALADFFLRHKDIGLVVVWGELDNVTDKPKTVAMDAPRVQRIPPEGWIETDAEILAELAKRRLDITGNKTKGRADHNGSLQSWVYNQGGVMALSVTLWDIPLDAKEQAESKAAPADPSKPAAAPADKAGEKKPEREPSEEAKRLAWLDAKGLAERYASWKPFEHPQLGPVEVGGWQPYARTEPPTADQATLAAKELEFLLTLGSAMARIDFVEVEAKELSKDLVELKAVLVNPHLLPVQCQAARRADSTRPARVRLVLPAGARALVGPPEVLVDDLTGMGGKTARRELRWLIQGAPAGALGLEADSDHAGDAQVRAKVIQ